MSQGIDGRVDQADWSLSYTALMPSPPRPLAGLVLLLAGCTSAPPRPVCPTSQELMTGEVRGPWKPREYVRPGGALRETASLETFAHTLSPMCEAPLWTLAADRKARAYRVIEGGGITWWHRVVSVSGPTRAPRLRRVDWWSRSDRWEESLRVVDDEHVDRLFDCLRQAGFWEMATDGGAVMMEDDNAELVEAMEAGRYHAVDLRSWRERPEGERLHACRVSRGALEVVTF